MERWFIVQNTCGASQRAWVWIPQTHIKLDTVVVWVCNPSPSMMRFMVGRPWEILGVGKPTGLLYAPKQETLSLARRKATPTPETVLWPLCVHSGMHVPTLTHTQQQHTHTEFKRSVIISSWKCSLFKLQDKFCYFVKHSRMYLIHTYIYYIWNSKKFEYQPQILICILLICD